MSATAAEPPSRAERDTDVGFAPPRPLGHAPITLGPAAVAIALWLLGVLSTPAALGFAGVMVVVASAQAALLAYDKRLSRDLADALLRSYPSAPVSALAAWRAAELTSPRSRRRLARRVRRLRTGDGELDDAFARIEIRLLGLAEPVAPLGMLELRCLLAGRARTLDGREAADVFEALSR